MTKSFNHNRIYYTALLDDWIVIISDCSGKQAKVFNTELWIEWDDANPEQSILNHAIDLFKSSHKA